MNLFSALLRVLRFSRSIKVEIELCLGLQLWEVQRKGSKMWQFMTPTQWNFLCNDICTETSYDKLTQSCGSSNAEHKLPTFRLFTRHSSTHNCTVSHMQQMFVILFMSFHITFCRIVVSHSVEIYFLFWVVSLCSESNLIDVVMCSMLSKAFYVTKQFLHPSHSLTVIKIRFIDYSIRLQSRFLIWAARNSSENSQTQFPDANNDLM